MSNRNSSIELLRLVLMFLIIIHHSVIHGMGLIDLGQSDGLPMHFSDMEKPIACIVNCLCICAVNCFVLISGYFSIKFKASKFISLILCVVFYTVCFSSTYFVSVGQYKTALWKIAIFSHPTYWFVADYIYLMILAPAINLIFKILSLKYQVFFLSSLAFISCYLGFVWHTGPNLNGYNLFQFVFMYSIGRFLFLHPINLNKFQAYLAYSGGALLTALIMIYFWNKDNIFWAWNMTCYNNPFIVLSAIGILSLFLYFKFECHIINKWAASAFAIYMVQSSVGAEMLYYNFINTLQITIGPFIWGVIPVCALLFIVISICIDSMQRPLNKFFTSYIMEVMKKLTYKIKV